MIFREGKTDDVGMRSGIGPALVKNEVAKRIINGFALIDFGWLPNMGVMAMNNVGTGVDKLMGKGDPPPFRRGQVFVAPVKRNDEPIDLGSIFLDILNNNLRIKFGVGNKVITQESENDTVDGFDSKFSIRIMRIDKRYLKVG